MEASTAVIRSVDDVLDARAVTTVFQPVVRLDSWHRKRHETVGYEALTRGPAGTPWEAPLALFEAAAGRGRLAELDWICRATAYRTAIDAGLPPGLTLFVNTEPAALSVPCPPDLAPAILDAQLRLRVVTEMTERAIGRDLSALPALLSAAEACRGSGWGVALDDVGVEPASLAVMPFAHPDVVKLDRHLTQHPAGSYAARVVTAVTAYAERSGAAVLAEGVETPGHLTAALGLGATLGQGWLFGRPGPLPPDVGQRHAAVGVPFVAPPANPGGRTPYEIVSARRSTAQATKRMLLPLSHHLETKALDPGEPAMLLASFQEARHLTPATARRYAAAAESAALVAALATELPGEPAPGVRGTAIGGDDPLRGEWNVIVAGPHFAGALVARDLADTGPDEDRRFTYAVTYDRDLVLDAARALLHRIVPT
ncbi:EAL domain-containing protein [Dactylosporangium sp. AC04546]|uniref:sensor domain-containing phosphodiesterase n=1 Tax=Dactylosporangium sp. AC04546 TaxID=2862460 RepID=UPI001EE059C4|nr:EAL domain-containing protein [Dactylosporangium sp. AC04546]WVK81791.1 EAL domain-containing protein [Dactylosporangium sp. AC04546]